MDHPAHKLLESTTLRTLHGHNFSRASSQASLVLTDLLSRYLTLLASSCAKYASHAGRRRFTINDAEKALDELGVGVDELLQWVQGNGEAVEMARWGYTRRRVEELNEMRTHLNDGLKQDKEDDVIPLVYAPLPEDYEDEEESDDEPEESTFDDMSIDEYVPPPKWSPPDHIPPFLPPFPAEKDPTSLPFHSKENQHPERPQQHEQQNQPQPQISEILPTSADYLSQTPYSESSLAAVPSWHLPSPPPSPDPHKPNSRSQKHPTPQTEPSLIGAYHHILTHPPSLKDPHPSRHKVSMALLSLFQSNPQYDSTDSLYASLPVTQPRVAPIGPTFPVQIGGEGKDFKYQPPVPRTVTGVCHSGLRSDNRISQLARATLAPNIYSRTSRLGHPAPLVRGTKPLVYGNSVPAPWNAGETPAIGDEAKKDGDVKKEGEVKKEAKGSVLPDARLFATWDYDTKDYRTPLKQQIHAKGRTSLR